MKRFLIASCFLLFFTTCAFAAPLQKGEEFPNLVLTGEITEQQQAYLGLSGSGDWRLSDINAEYIIIEIFSMYCPHCQAEAPHVNDLYTMLTDSEANPKMKLIGIGVGNSAFEVNFFKDKYKTTLPLFHDKELTVHTQVGQPGTPHFFIVKRPTTKGAPLQTVYSYEGRMSSPQTFLKELLQATGL